MTRHLKFGMEEEYFITDLDSRCMSGKPPGAAIDACKAVLGECFAHEMFQGQIEVASPIFTSLAQAAQYLGAARQALRLALQPYGLGLLTAGSHPLADWRTQQATEQTHFLKLFDDYQHLDMHVQTG